MEEAQTQEAKHEPQKDRYISTVTLKIVRDGDATREQVEAWTKLRAENEEAEPIPEGLSLERLIDTQIVEYVDSLDFPGEVTVASSTRCEVIVEDDGSERVFGDEEYKRPTDTTSS